MSASISRPLLLLNLYLDNDPTSGGSAVKNFSGKTITFHNVTFRARVLSWGTVDRSISNPPGDIQIDDAEIELADTDGNIRQWFDTTTPFRRLGELIFDRENNLGEAYSNLDSPVMGWTSTLTNTNTNPPVVEGPIQDPYWKPLFTGEIIAVKFGPGTATVRFQEVTTKLLNWEIPKLITRDNFPNLPDDANEGDHEYTAPIIFGRVTSLTGSGIDPQGVIRCWEIDTVAHRYCIARHTCYSNPVVYRKRENDARFKVVSATEYAIHTPIFVINGISYQFTVIDFIKQQDDGTVIHCDISGINFRYDYSTGVLNTGGEQRNPVDAIFNLIFYAAMDHAYIQNQPQTYISFDPQAFLDTWVAVSNVYLCDGAITHAMTVGQAIAQICGDFSIDFYENNQAQIAVHFYNPATDSHIPIDSSIVLLKTLHPELPNKYYTRVRYHYYRQNAHLSEWTKSSVEGQYEEEKLLDNVTDQFELAQTGSNPIVEVREKLEFIRDESTALALQKIKMGYYNLRSYYCEFEVPIPEVILYMQLGACISLTHVQGIGPAGTGWASKLMRIYALNFDLNTYRLTVKAIVRVSVPDGNFQYSGSGPIHGPQKRIPPYPVLVNGTLDGGVGPDIDPDGEPQLNLVDSDSFLPASTLTIPSTFSYSYRDGTTGTDSSNDAVVVPVKWIEQQDQVPRVAGGYVLIPKAGKFSSSFYVGTLSPDTRPSLGTSDINKALFYSTDFDHLYLYVGTGESGTSSGWRCVEETCGSIVLRWDAPTQPGWHICDGTTVNRSDYQGSVASFALPALYPTTDTLLELASSSSIVAGTKVLTDNASLPSCLSATGVTISRVRLIPYMRL